MVSDNLVCQGNLKINRVYNVYVCEEGGREGEKEKERKRERETITFLQ